MKSEKGWLTTLLPTTENDFSVPDILTKKPWQWSFSEATVTTISPERSPPSSQTSLSRLSSTLSDTVPGLIWKVSLNLSFHLSCSFLRSSALLPGKCAVEVNGSDSSRCSFFVSYTKTCQSYGQVTKIFWHVLTVSYRVEVEPKFFVLRNSLPLVACGSYCAQLLRR